MKFLLCAATLLHWPNIPEPETREPPVYPWDDQFVGELPCVSASHFRCNGSGMNPVREDPVRGERIADCRGFSDHGLPMRDGEEFVYPVLIDLLNWIQQQTGKPVQITCGHRCPAHNMYADTSRYNQTSKHQIAAEVDFFVEGMEQEPQRIVDLILAYYQLEENHGGSERMQRFERYEKPDTNVSTPPWYNREVFIKLFQADEGRDLDNTHPFPYISIQVRWDRDRDERVTYSWDAARYYLHR